MKPLTQKYLHIPDKQHGDCWRNVNIVENPEYADCI